MIHNFNFKETPSCKYVQSLMAEEYLTQAIRSSIITIEKKEQNRLQIEVEESSSSRKLLFKRNDTQIVYLISLRSSRPGAI